MRWRFQVRRQPEHGKSAEVGSSNAAAAWRRSPDQVPYSGLMRSRNVRSEKFICIAPASRARPTKSTISANSINSFDQSDQAGPSLKQLALLTEPLSERQGQEMLPRSDNLLTRPCQPSMSILLRSLSACKRANVRRRRLIAESQTPPGTMRSGNPVFVLTDWSNGIASKRSMVATARFAVIDWRWLTEW